MKSRQKEILSAYLYILPSIAVILLISIIPIFMAFSLSFTKYNIIQPPQSVGFANYIRLFKDNFVMASLKNTLTYTAVVVPVQTVLSLIIAFLIAEFFQTSFGGFLKSTMFIPVISSGILVATIWSFILAPENGAINSMLKLAGLAGINWLGQTKTSLLSICIVSIWKNTGYFLAIYYAGLMDIPRSIIEASRVEGARGFQRFLYIILPYLKPITLLVITLGTIWSFQVFDLVYLMTSGGPGLSTMTLGLTIYNASFKEYNMGYACAVAFLLFAFVFIITSVQKLFFKEDC